MFVLGKRTQKIICIVYVFAYCIATSDKYFYTIGFSLTLPTNKTTFNIIGLINSISNGLPIQYKNYWNTMSHRIYIFYKFEGTYIAEGHGHCEMKSWLLLEIIK